MLFNSYTFVIFLTIVLIIYYLLPKWEIRKLVLLISSYIFYAVWNPPFVFLIWLSTISDFVLARKVYESKDISKKKYFLSLSLIINLGLLIFFKYSQFLLDNFVWLLGLFDISYIPPELNIILPIGISFYTFQTLSYTIDIYKGSAKPCESFLDFALYVTFFPQLVAGPIVRSDKFLSQCKEDKFLDWDQIGLGLTWLTIGLFLKSVVSDAFLAPVADTVYNHLGTFDFVTAWIGTLAFSGQILCDFAGYSICAIGVALCLGFELPKNFYFPYAAIGFSDFWRRWHITLSTWLRDYVYIACGGSRKGKNRTFINLMITMLIGGLWHGAAWTFVVWGMLHGFYLIAERLLREKFHYINIKDQFFAQLFFGLLTFFLVTITWVFFRASTFDQAFTIVSAMFSFDLNGSSSLNNKSIVLVLFIMLITLITNWYLKNKELEKIIRNMKWWQVSIGLSVMIYLILTLPTPDRSFIYFQF